MPLSTFFNADRSRGCRRVGASLALPLLLMLAALGCSSVAPTAAPSPTSVAADPTTAPAQPDGQLPTEPPAATPEIIPEATEPPAPAQGEAAMAKPTDAAPPEPAPASMDAEPDSEPESEPGGGMAYVVGAGSEATFTVNEKLAWLDLPNDAVMRTTGLSGMLYLDGQPSVVELDLHSMTSDSDRRDRYVRQRMFPDHPTAVFTVIDLGELPDPVPVGEVIAREVPGELAIGGVTRPITFAVEARLDSAELFVLGRTAFTWQELDIPPPNIPGRIQVKDEVRVEVLLAARPEDAGDGGP